MTLEESANLRGDKCSFCPEKERPPTCTTNARRRNIPPSGPRGAKAEVVLLAIAQAERHVERADRVDQCAADKHAKPDAGRQIRIAGYCSADKRGADGFRIVAEAPGIVDAEPRE